MKDKDQLINEIIPGRVLVLHGYGFRTGMKMIDVSPIMHRVRRGFDGEGNLDTSQEKVYRLSNFSKMVIEE